MQITDKPGRYFWSNGSAWGICVVDQDCVQLQVLKGTLKLKKMIVGSRQIHAGDLTLQPSDSVWTHKL